MPPRRQGRTGAARIGASASAQDKQESLVTYVFSMHGVTAAMLGGFAGLLGQQRAGSVKARESASIGWLLAAASSVLVFWGVAPVLMESMVHCVYGRWPWWPTARRTRPSARTGRARKTPNSQSS